jgi:pimeloyl-ACP methyl ester carboxylesterase
MPMLRLRSLTGVVGVCLALGCATTRAEEAGEAQRQAPPPAAASTAPDRHTVQSDGHPMALWGRKPATPRGSILLIHGRTWSGRPDFDLQVPGLRRSVLSSFVAQGFAAYALDLRGYGETPRDASGWLTPRRSAADIVNVLEWVAKQHPGLPKPVLVGWSRGGALVQMVAQNAAARISAVVIYGFAYDPEAEFADIDDLLPKEPLKDKNTAESAVSDFISPDITPKAVVNAYVQQALKADPILMDLKGDKEFNDLKPEKVLVPTLVMYGEKDPGIPHEDAGKYFAKLGAPDRQMVVLPGADHAALLEDTHDMWISAIVNFITHPPVKR